MDTDKKTLISDSISIEELHKRKVIFIINEMLSVELFSVFKKFTDETGIKFKIEYGEGFIIMKKIEN